MLTPTRHPLAHHLAAGSAQRFVARWLLAALFWAAGATGVAAADDNFPASPLARLATRLAPGEFRPLPAPVLPAGVDQLSQLLKGYREDGSSAPPIYTWTDSAHWDTQRKRVFFQGLRKSNRFLSYRALENRWEELSLEQPDAPPRFERFGHLYGRSALDAGRGHFYRLAGSTLHRYTIDQGRWQRFDKTPLGGYIPIGWNLALDALVGVERGQLHAFTDGVWQTLGPSPVDGRHSSAKYNPQRRDMLFIGGNKSRQTVALLSADGKLKRMRDAPFAFGISADNLTHDPLSGHYLVLHRDRVLWEYDPDGDEWRVALDMRAPGGDWPFSRGGIVPVPIDELGVVLWLAGNRPLLYRHRSVF